MLLRLAISYGVGLIGLILWGYPADPDVLFSHSKVAGVFLIFMFFALSLIGWGSFWSKRFGLSHLEPLSSVLLGTIGGALCIALWGSVGVLGQPWNLAEIAALSLGPWVGSNFGMQNLKAIRFKDDSTVLWCGFSVFLICLVLRLFSASLAHGTSDPFLYHLLAPRIWWEQGRILVPQNIPISFQSTLWEYLITWGNILFAGPSGRGLIETHLFGQFLHVFFGFGSSYLALWMLGIGIHASLGTSVVASLVALSSDALWDFSWLAKNDLGAIFWSISAVTLLITAGPLSINRRWVGFGAIAGFSFAAKWNMAQFLLPIGLFWIGKECFEESSDRKKYVLWAAAYSLIAAVIAAAPITLRNWILAGNPVFPNFDSYFHSPVLSAYERRAAELMIGPRQEVKETLYSLWGVIRDNLASLGLFVFLASCFMKAPKNRVQYSLLAIASLFAYLLYSSFDMSRGFMRWIGPSLLIIPFLGSISIISGIQDLFERPAFRKLRSFSPLIGILISLGVLGYHLSRNYSYVVTALFGAPPNYIIRNDDIHLGGASMAWLRMNAQPSDLIVSTGNNEIYYLSGLNVRVIGEDLDWEKRLAGINDPKDVLALLVADGARYLYDTQHFNAFYWGKFATLLNVLIQEHPESIVFQSTRSKVVDAVKLQVLIKQGEVNHSRPQDRKT